ncbi:hypothetical protein ACRRTK_016859 [Alexandromys fortis]
MEEVTHILLLFVHLSSFNYFTCLLFFLLIKLKNCLPPKILVFKLRKKLNRLAKLSEPCLC